MPPLVRPPPRQLPKPLLALTALACLLRTPSASASQATGPEFRVNSTTIFNQRDPVIASDSSGKFVVEIYK